jgi:hypothetical protein
MARGWVETGADIGAFGSFTVGGNGGAPPTAVGCVVLRGGTLARISAFGGGV